MVSTHDAEHYAWGADCHGWHLVRSPHLSVIQERVPPGSRETRHYHSRSEQFFYILKGAATLEVDGAVNQLREQQGLHIPPRVPHQLSNESDSDLHFLVISTPPSHGDRTDAQQADTTDAPQGRTDG